MLATGDLRIVGLAMGIAVGLGASFPLGAFAAEVIYPANAEVTGTELVGDGESSSFSKSVSPLFNWSNELIKTDVPEVGHRYMPLSRGELAALRRGFKLPLDVIAGAESPNDLVRLAVVRPLPDPAKPFIPVEPIANGNADPFGGEEKQSSLGPLGRMFAIEGQAMSDTAGPEAVSVGGAESLFGGEVVEGGSTASPDPLNDAEETPDPFGDSDDPFDF